MATGGVTFSYSVGQMSGRASGAIATEPSCADLADPAPLTVEEARRRIEADIVPVAEREEVALRDSLGRVLAEDVLSSIDVPAHVNSAFEPLRPIPARKRLPCSGWRSEEMPAARTRAGVEVASE
jgi:hypothetical protein